MLSRLDYCSGVLAGLPSSTLAPLQQFSHAAARFVDKLGQNDHVTAALKNLNEKSSLVASQTAHRVQVVSTHAQSKCRQASVCMSEMLTACSAVPALITRLRSSASGDYIVPRTIRNLGDRAFSVSDRLLWNALANDNKSAQSTGTFKRLVKTYFVKGAYG